MPRKASPRTVAQYEAIAASRGMKLLRRHDTKPQKWIYALPCGHEDEFYPQKVAFGSGCRCRTCGAEPYAWDPETNPAPEFLSTLQIVKPALSNRVDAVEASVATLTEELLAAAEVIRVMNARIAALEGGAQ